MNQIEVYSRNSIFIGGEVKCEERGEVNEVNEVVEENTKMKNAIEFRTFRTKYTLHVRTYYVPPKKFQ